MAEIKTRVGMPVDAFIAAYDAAPFELIDGQHLPKMPTVSGHNRLAKRMFIALLPFEQAGAGEVFQEATYVLLDSPDWVRGSRIPDVIFISAAKLDAFRRSTPDTDNKPFTVVPDIVIEIVSPTDSYTLIRDRVRRYLTDGVRLVWVIDPQTREVAVHTAGSDEQLNLSGDALLDGGEVLSEFSLKVSEIWG
jgi:Uma2 family endonuclease